MTIILHPNPDNCTTTWLHFLLGYLNSEISWLWLRSTNPQDPKVLPKWRQEDIESVRVPVAIGELNIIPIAVLAHRISQCLASGYFALQSPAVRDMRWQLLARLGRALNLSENNMNLILDFLDEDISAPYRPFKYPKRIPPLKFIELPDRPIAEAGKPGDLWETAPLSDDERRRKEEWEDRINGPLPHIYDVVPDPQQVELVDRLEEFSSHLDRIEEILKKQMH